MSKAKVLTGLVVLTLVVISYAGLPLLAVDSASSDPGVIAARQCCKYGSDCPDNLCCLAPNPNEADCSQNRPYYCRQCNIVAQ